MATSSIGGYNFMQGFNAQNNIMQSMDVSKLTTGTISTADSATLSSVLGNDYTNYQNLLSGMDGGVAGTTATTAAANGSVSSVGNGVGMTSDGMFDFKSYLTTYFPNLSEEEVTKMTSFYSEAYNKMYEQIGGAMDMSNLAGMVTGTNSIDTSSILKQTHTAAKESGNAMSFDVSSYLKNYFPTLNSTQVTSLTDTYKNQYAGLTKA